MTRDPDLVAGSDSLIEVAYTMYTMRSLLAAFLPVCDQDGDLQGIIAPRDLPRVVRGADPAGVTASTLAAEPAVTNGVDDPVDQVSELMAGQRMWLLPVLEGRRLVGVIHYAAVRGPAIPRSAQPSPSQRPSRGAARTRSRPAAAGSRGRWRATRRVIVPAGPRWPAPVVSDDHRTRHRRPILGAPGTGPAQAAFHPRDAPLKWPAGGGTPGVGRAPG